jgi:hypothetical protein
MGMAHTATERYPTNPDDEVDIQHNSKFVQFYYHRPLCEKVLRKAISWQVGNPLGNKFSAVQFIVP